MKLYEVTSKCGSTLRLTDQPHKTTPYDGIDCFLDCDKPAGASKDRERIEELLMVGGAQIQRRPIPQAGRHLDPSIATAKTASDPKADDSSGAAMVSTSALTEQGGQALGVVVLLPMGSSKSEVQRQQQRWGTAPVLFNWVQDCVSEGCFRGIICGSQIDFLKLLRPHLWLPVLPFHTDLNITFQILALKSKISPQKNLEEESG